MLHAPSAQALVNLWLS